MGFGRKSQELPSETNTTYLHTLQVVGRWNKLPALFHSLLLMGWNPSAWHLQPNFKEKKKKKADIKDFYFFYRKSSVSNLIVYKHYQLLKISTRSLPINGSYIFLLQLFPIVHINLLVHLELDSFLSQKDNQHRVFGWFSFSLTGFECTDQLLSWY